MPEWTKEQKQAIYKKNSNLLVAAAAGSGKTTVLVERIINKIVNENVDINNLLVVTFTNAAASEMKERILDVIYKKLEEQPDNDNLQKQITLLNMASICTIDSFCLEVVKNNFYELENISPNFRIADTAEIEIIKQEILEEIFEEKYEKEDEDFVKLITTYTSYKDDKPLKDLILKIHNYISSFPYPLEWLHEKIEIFNMKDLLKQDFSKTIWGKVLLKEIEEELEDDIAILQESQKSMEKNEQLELYMQTLQSDIKQLELLKINLNNWDKAFEIFQNLKFSMWPRKKVESEIKEEAKKVRDNVKKKLYKKLDKILISNSKEANQDIFDMYQTLVKLENLVLEFEKIFSNKKKEQNIADFTDIEHFALQILLKKDENGNLEKTEVAKKYTEKFEEISIDEYQDSNLIQEYILTSISKGNNIFMVGDVKQSIYRFRQAMPKLFLDKYDKFIMVNDNDDNENILQQGKKIQLFKNFRSRNNIIEFTNLIFKNIMSKELGEINYNEEEYLNYGATYYKDSKEDLKTEINIINLNEKNEEILEDEKQEENEEHFEEIEIEAKYVAQKINKMLQDKMQIFDTKIEEFRDIKYKDIVILLRSTKNKANIYEQEILKLGMPVFCDSNQEYLDSLEIQTIISLLKIIDNPMQDIPLVAVMRSIIGGFTDDELVEIRLSDKYDNFYTCMKKAKIDVNLELKEKIEKFLNMLEKWRKEQEYLALDELIWKIYSDTGYYNYVGLMPNGELRQANLRILFERAKKYETASFKGLYNFISFIERLKNNSGDLNSAKIIGENEDVIRIMSIHKSKGLEFPVVFLVNTNKKFNEQDSKLDPVLLHQDLGIGAKYINYNKQIQYDTLAREALKNIIKDENISEEMRILYVAITRAKEKLIITGISKDFQKQIEDIKKQIKIYSKNNNKINKILLKKYKSYLDWIILTYLYEENNANKLITINNISKDFIIKNNKKELKINNNLNNIKNKLEKKEINLNEKKSKEIINKIEYIYKYNKSVLIPTKTSVTAIKNLEKENNKEIIFSKPLFLQQESKEELSGAEKGTILHLCMQKLDFKEEYNIEKIEKLIFDLIKKEIITEKEASIVNKYKILQFTKSFIWKELKNAKEIHKEKPFYINIPANKIYDNNVDETLLVQGIIDLYYINENDELILLDYKTDFVENNIEELKIKYENQLNLYKEALEKSLNRKVDKTYIYSIYLGKEIEI